MQRFITHTSNLSFGIYLCHIAIMRHLIWRLPCIQSISNYLLQYLAIVALTAALSFLTAYLISRLPLSPYLIGYQQTPKAASPNPS